MAQAVTVSNPATGHVRIAYVGFSWTTLFFGMFPALLRGHILAALVMAIAPFLTFGLSWLVFPFFYNSWHRSWLANRGYGAAGAYGMPGIAANNTNTVQPVINVHIDNSARPPA
ncbi:hypothetical protein GCM10011322_27090 [Salinarimonas ramus]|uniref:Uncharacterized protein n=2 Tax=Salinarimonas ramus TaxID=690164 RepID=A0A917QA28_9HYPH|nr:hypothetical protein GCM10011322_27090 [Salinarimonas ramus]